MSGEATPAMHIGEVAARTELSLRSLRHWEDVGLIVPTDRIEGGFRLYTEADVEKILFVRRMKPLGFSLDEMKAVMVDLEALRDSTTDDAGRSRARDHLADVQRDAAERRSRLERQVAMADEFLGLLADELA